MKTQRFLLRRELVSGAWGCLNMLMQLIKSENVNGKWLHYFVRKGNADILAFEVKGI